MRNKPEERAKISFIFYYINRIKEIFEPPLQGLVNILSVFQCEEKEMDKIHEISLGTYYFDQCLCLNTGEVKGIFLENGELKFFLYRNEFFEDVLERISK